MIQSNNTNITQRQRFCYRNLSVRNLRRTNLGRVSYVSPQQEVNNQISGSIGISVDSKPTGFTFQFPFSSDLINMTTPTASFGSMVRIGSNNINLLLGCNYCERLPELEVRDFVDNLINSSSFGISKLSSSSQELQVLNNNVGNIELIGEFNNLVADLKASCPDKIIFKSSDFSQTSQGTIAESLIIDASELIFSQFNFSPFMGNILPEIKLPQDFFIFIHNRQSKISSIQINSHNIPFVLADKILFDTNLQNPFISFNQSTGFENPAIRDMAFKSLEQPVLGNKQDNPLTFHNSRKGKERSIPFSFSISKHLRAEINRQSFNFVSNLSPVPNNNSGTDDSISPQQSKFFPTILVGGVV